MESIINSNQLLLMSNVEIEKCLRGKHVILTTQKNETLKGIVTGFELATNYPHLIVTIVINNCRKIYINQILEIAIK